MESDDLKVQAPVSRVRRAAISVFVIVFCLGLIAYLGVQTTAFPLGESVVRGAFSLAELVIMFYIGGSVVDSSSLGLILSTRAFGPPAPVKGTEDK